MQPLKSGKQFLSIDAIGRSATKSKKLNTSRSVIKKPEDVISDTSFARNSSLNRTQTFNRKKSKSTKSTIPRTSNQPPQPRILRTNRPQKPITFAIGDVKGAAQRISNRKETSRSATRHPGLASLGLKAPAGMFDNKMLSPSSRDKPGRQSAQIPSLVKASA